MAMQARAISAAETATISRFALSLLTSAPVGGCAQRPAILEANITVPIRSGVQCRLLARKGNKKGTYATMHISLKEIERVQSS
jgi:hypothetical protein